MAKLIKDIVHTGLDIGNAYIKLVQLSGALSELTLVNFEVFKINRRSDDLGKSLEDIARRLTTHFHMTNMDVPLKNMPFVKSR